MLKQNSCRNVLDMARDKWDVLRGNGISYKLHMMQDLMNLEAIDTYTGTLAASSALLLFTSSPLLLGQETEGHSKASQHLSIPRMMSPTTATPPILSQGDCVRDTSMLLASWVS
ncbi:unnamed protein product [Coccothraustes coccothraustes]